MKSVVVEILLADDHGLFRDSMAVWLNQLDKALTIQFASSFDEVTQRLREDAFDLILLDLGMPGMQGVISIKHFCHEAGATPIVIVSADENPVTISACIDAGAAGYVAKSASGETILNAIRQVLAGARYIPANASSQKLPRLNDRQKQILALVIDGCSNKVISEKMSLTEGTVKQYISQLLRDLNVDNRTQAASIARELLGIGGS